MQKTWSNFRGCENNFFFINKNLLFFINNHFINKSIVFLQELPSQINSDEERELLALMLRVHELEADKMMLQSERLVKQHELRRRELMLLRYDRQRQISDEIITRQRRIMEGMVSKKKSINYFFTHN